jgi:acyl carrier protein
MITELSSRDQIEDKLTKILVEMFELEPADVTEDASLYDDLDIDSIDAVDLIVRLKELTGKKVEPEDFKEIRTVSDVVAAVESLLRE